MLKAYKYRLKPTKEQRIFFEKSFGSVRFIYNQALAKRIEAYQSEGKRINAVDLCKMLTDLKKEEGMEWLKEVSKTIRESNQPTDRLLTQSKYKARSRKPSDNHRGLEH